MKMGETDDPMERDGVPHEASPPYLSRLLRSGEARHREASSQVKLYEV